MTTFKGSYHQQLRTLAELMLAVAGESVTVMKKNAPQQAMKLKRQDEWGLYLEFIKVMFNLTDRLSAFHIPIKDQPEFMNGLEDAVTSHLKTALEPAFGSSLDQTEIMMTVGGAVAESRELYEQYRFSINEDSKSKNAMFDAFGGRIADTLGVSGNREITSAATLCATAVVPAISAILQGQTPPDSPSKSSPGEIATVTGDSASMTKTQTGNEIKLISVMSNVSGEEVETRWGLHPRFRQDLTSDELQQLTKLMNRVAKILGERYATVAFSNEWTSWHKAGHA
ncbi:hypothetical protein W02_38490 [Nitrospira sp. KM1]|uniref:hypothetical protein n=1 Tax=Nitrospira sp. KM1 TaxID=1936990 RepID=UPI0013A766D2|nr:hypothetical protein [Nitrospira sp. KM1]BCA56709.1 hypothetical protein W02_38490 [Nitrospira sp. KM1]